MSWRRAVPGLVSVATQGAIFTGVVAMPDAMRTDIPIVGVGAVAWLSGAAAFRAVAGAGRSWLWYAAWCGPVGGSVAALGAAGAAALLLAPVSPLDEADHARFEAALAAAQLRSRGAAARRVV